MIRQIHILMNVNFGGGEQSLETLANAYPDHVTLILTRKSNRIRHSGNILNSSLLKAKNNYNLYDAIISVTLALYYLFKTIFFNRNVHIILHGFPFQFLLLVNRILSPSNIVLHYVYHQEKSSTKLYNKFLRVIEYVLVKMSRARIYTVSHFASSALSSYFFGDPGLRIKNFPLPYEPITPSVGHCKLQSIIADNRPYLLYIARFDPVKSHERLIRFWLGTAGLLSKYRLVLIGDGSRRERLEKYCSPFSEDIIFTGHIQRARLFEIYFNCEAIVFPSLSEAMPVTFQEAAQFRKWVYCFETKFLVFPNTRHITKLEYDASNDFKLLPALGLGKFNTTADTFNSIMS